MHRLPESPDEWMLLAALVILGLAYDYFVTRLAGRRNRDSRCARCGRPFDADDLSNVDMRSPYGQTMVICASCASKRNGTWRAAGYGLIVMLCGITAAVIILVVKNHGIDRSQIGLAVAYPLVLALALGVASTLLRTDSKNRKRKRKHRATHK
jgi:hypothetical protein